MNSLNAAMRLLDSTVLPHRLYAAPCWALNQVKVVDQVQNIFLRRYLNLPKYTPGFMLRMECGRVSQEVIITKQRLSVVQNVLRRPRRCERRRACRTPEHFNNRRKINEVEKMILANRRITVREVAEDLNISIGSCHSIFINDLGMRRVAAKFVPKLLNCDQTQHRMNIANEILVRGCIPNVDCGIRRSYLGPKQRLSVVQNVLRRPRRCERRRACRTPEHFNNRRKINEVEKMILANRRITVREVAEDLNISIGSCHSIFINDLGMRRVAAKFVPKLLNCDQTQHRMNIANEILDSVRDDPNLLQRVITGEEAWVYGYDVETKAQSSQWKLPHEPRPKKARQVRSNVKVLLTVFFDCRGVVHHEFLPQGRTVNKKYYLQVMCNLRVAIRQKRPDL
ncbi:hypothetical protein LAZ67_23001099 [Cordylochernes scorpioides]|uniref:Transposase n=1 Tax=Cordylochernes scorpioides TaxID=51811 RepID=A0ABY6LUE6_9ARAC|nr:hypothetical protein LAZ67_23001099 [Cordylochernes scorpioides]